MLPGERERVSQDDDKAARPSSEPHRRFLGIAKSDMEAARLLWAIVGPQIGGIVDRFYAKLRASHIPLRMSDEVVERLKAKQQAHWARLFSSQFDDDYMRSVRRVGIRHRDIKLGTAWYVAAYMVLKMEIVNCILKANIPLAQKGRMLRAAEKYIALDMVIALSAYDNAAGVVD